MATTLTLGGSGFTNATYNITPTDFPVVNNTTVNDTIAIGSFSQAQKDFFFTGNNSATLFTDPANGTVTKVSLDLGNGSDTLLVNAALIGNAVNLTNAAATVINMGGGSDSLTVNQFAQRVKFELGGGNDTVVINEFTPTDAFDIKNSAFNLGTGADSLIVNADLFATNISAGVGATDGSDTIVLRGTNDTGVTIASFNVTGGALADTLIIGGVAFDGSTYTGSTGTFNSTANLAGTGDGIDAVNAWLDLGNSITLI